MICSVSMEPFATSRRELARVQKVGQVPIAAKELVTINFTALDALKSARALPTTPNCKKLVWCLGRTSLYPIFSYDHVRCHPWTGECICKEGWDGQTCSRPCPTYTFGLGCRNVCTCKNDAHCDPVNGTCVCLSGIDPPPPSLVRSIIVLASILFLFFRSVPFHKQQQATSATTARIPVQRGFTDTIVPTSALVKTEATAQIRTDNANVLSDGPVSCVNLRAGPAFTGRIARSNVTVKTELLAITWLVSPSVIIIFETFSIFHRHFAGECSCSAGFKDDACNATCPEGRFGLNCEETCECQKGTTKACDPVTGECLCHANYRGVRCETQCPKGRYGPECRNVCHCENDGSCDNLGDCFCQRGWTGELCEDSCPQGISSSSFL